MAYTKTEICNMALGHLGVQAVIANLDTDQSAEARALRVFYELARVKSLEDKDWGFARRYATLNLVAETPNINFNYSYRYPSNALVIRRILSGLRNDHRNSRVSYDISSDSTGKLILTDMEQAQIIYTYNVDNLALFSASYVLAFSIQLAIMIAPKLTAGDQFQKVPQLEGMYTKALNQAVILDANEEQKDPEPESELTFARQGDDYNYGRG